MAKKTTTTTKAQYDYIKALELAEIVTYTALKARHSKSGMQFILDLMNGARSNHYILNCAELVERADKHHKKANEYRTQKEEHQKVIERLERMAVNVKTTKADRVKALEEVDRLKAENEVLKGYIKAESETAEGIARKYLDTLTDTADLTQTALFTAWQIASGNVVVDCAKAFDEAEEEKGEELTEEEQTDIRNRLEWRYIVNAVGKAIRTQATPDALTSTRTKRVEINKAEYERLIKAYGEGTKIPMAKRNTTESECYLTLDIKEGKYYKIAHYKTVASYQYIEDMREDDEDTNPLEYIKVYNPFVFSISDIEMLEEIYKRANLNDRQRAYLYYYTQKARYTDSKHDCEVYACGKIGVTTADNQRQFVSRLYRQIRKALPNRTELINQIEREISRKPKSYKVKAVADYNALEWVEKAMQSHTEPLSYSIVEWLTSEQAETERAEKEQRAKALAEKSEINYTAEEVEQMTERANKDIKARIKAVKDRIKPLKAEYTAICEKIAKAEKSVDIAIISKKKELNTQIGILENEVERLKGYIIK